MAAFELIRLNVQSTNRMKGQMLGFAAAANGANPKSEAGIGAIMPWADALYVMNYPVNNGIGNGLGLWRVEKDLSAKLVVEHNQIHPGRIIYKNQLYIGHLVVAADGTISTITGYDTAVDRITAYATNGSVDPYFLTMAGKLYQVNDATKVATLVTDMAANLSMTPSFTHGKALWMHSGGNLLIGGFNFETPNGRLFAYQIDTQATTSLDTGNNSWIEVGGSYENNKHIFCFGHDGLSPIMWVFRGTGTIDLAPKRKIRFPWASRQQKHAYQQEWMRLRPVETERFLIPFHQQWVQVSNWLGNVADSWTNDLPIIEVAGRTLRTTPDHCFWNGFWVQAGNQNTPLATTVSTPPQYPQAGQAQSGLVLTTLDDLTMSPVRAASGHWWAQKSVGIAEESEPMLRRGYGIGSIHLLNTTGTAVDVDILFWEENYAGGTGVNKYVWKRVTVPNAAGGGLYIERDIPQTYMVSVRPVTACTNLSVWMSFN